MQMQSLFEELNPIDNLGDLREHWKRCQRCEFWPARKQVVFWDGQEGAAVMLVGQHPGKDEDRTGLCYTGRAGKACRDAATNIAQIPEHDQFWTNSVCCYPPGIFKPGWIKNCYLLLEEQIRIVQPKLIVAMGHVAARRMSATRGGRIPKEPNQGRFGYGPDLIPTMIVTFPAAIYRQHSPDKKQGVVRRVRMDFEDVGKLYRTLIREE